MTEPPKTTGRGPESMTTPGVSGGGIARSRGSSSEGGRAGGGTIAPPRRSRARMGAASGAVDAAVPATVTAASLVRSPGVRLRGANVSIGLNQRRTPRLSPILPESSLNNYCYEIPNHTEQMAAEDDANRCAKPPMTRSPASTVEDVAVHLAEQVCRVYQHHDRRAKQPARRAQFIVDKHQFAHLDEEEARLASEKFIEALWAKDAIEADYIADGEVHRQGLEAVDWRTVEVPLAQRADVVGMSPEYAEKTVEAWRNHKTDGDYWTAIQQAQIHELRAALQDQEYPHKPKYGQAGFGPEAARYALAIELHDMHTEEHWAQAIEIMTTYFERILRAHRKQEA